MKILPRDRFQLCCCLLLAVVFVASCLNPPYLQFLLMQHVPTVLAGLLLLWLANRLVISRHSFFCMTLFLCLHTLGARYLYSYTPYDNWTEQIFGVTITEIFDFQRNHYDRLVHFSYGLLLVIPVQEFERRYLKLSFFWSSVLAVEFILATSAAYELLEWIVAVTFTPEWADQFLGQQGDQFDAMKDMALATSGAVLSMLVMAVVQRRKE